MQNKRTYLDSLNAGRQRRPQETTLEQLNRSLETLEQRIDRNRDEAGTQYPGPRRRQDGYFGDHPVNPFEDGRGLRMPPAAGGGRTAVHDQPHQSIARDLERLRGQEEGAAAFGKIASELRGLREELRHQVTAGLRREFDTLRQDIERAYRMGNPQGAEKLGHEFERLSAAIQALADKSDDKSITMLRLELEQVRAAIDTLAREDSVRAVDRRWDDFDQRWNAFADRVSDDVRKRTPDPAIAGLNERLEQISTAVHNLPESLSLRSLEEKVRTLAGAVDHFGVQQSNRVPETFSLIEERLEEISRAIVASSAAAQEPHFDPAPFERIEARISALARQIEEVADDRPSGEIMDRLNLLSQRVDEMALRSDLPQQAVERLARQIELVAGKIDGAPAGPDAGEILSGFEKRFDVLAGMIERRQGDAIEHGSMLFREMERRLEDVAERLERRESEKASMPDTAHIMEAIDARFAELARTIETSKPDTAGAAAIKGLEARLDEISSRIDHSASQIGSVDPMLIRNLESQVAALSEHLSRPAAPLPEFEDLGPRLDEIEKSIENSRQTIIETARKAAEDAARNLSGSQPDNAAVSGLAQDLKALETLARKSDERNTRTFEAIHDTLLKIVDRLASIETQDNPVAARALEAPAAASRPAPMRRLADAPSIDPDHIDPDEPAPDAGQRRRGRRQERRDRTPAEAAAEAAIAALGSDAAEQGEQGGSRMRSMLGGLTRAFGGKKEQAVQAQPKIAARSTVEPTLDLDAPLDPKLTNQPLEPGSGAPDLNAIIKRVRDERGPPSKGEGDAAKADFIAAARRAAQAAAAEAELLKRQSTISGPVKALRLGELLKSRRKPLLLATGGIIIALAGLQLGKAFFSDRTEIAGSQSDTVPAPAMMAGAISADEPLAGEDYIKEVTPEASAVRVIGEAPLPEELSGSEELSGDGTAMSAGPTEVAVLDRSNPDLTNSTTPALTVNDADSGLPPPSAAAAPGAAASIEISAKAGPAPLVDAARNGDAKALFEVATRYAEGRGIKADMTEAARYYEKAAELGFAPAQYRAGSLYEKGLGVTRDVAKAKTWYQLSASQGNASAMHNLAVLFAMGADGVTDNESAARWFQDAAELGVKDSQFNLGILAAKGVGMEQNLEESYKWFALVAKAGDRDASQKRDEIANALRPEQLERAKAATELWKPKAVDAETNSVEIPEAWQDGGETTASVDMKKAIRQIQGILNDQGYDAGKADGMIGQKTKLAIAAFQKDKGLDPTGEVDEKLVRALIAAN